MASSPDNLSMALFCDFENVALGVRDAQYNKFDIKPVLERLLLKGSIVVKKAYCDWDRYKGFKSTMHEANFELIEIPHVRQSGKNSADIRLVVDALDLCYTKAHVNTFVIISGDSDFSPLVSKLRENAKTVIGVGVKQSTSDLLIANCDEFIFYDDLVRESQRAADQRAASTAERKKSGDDKRRNKDDLDARRTKAVELATETFDALVAERGDSGKIWASVLKEAIKRRRPDFNESYFGFRAFGNLLEEAQSRGLLSFGRDEKSGAYVYRNTAAPADGAHADNAFAIRRDLADLPDAGAAADVASETSAPREQSARDNGEPRRRGRGKRVTAQTRAADDTAEHSPDTHAVHTAADAAPSAPFVIPAHAQAEVQQTSGFNPHAPENTPPAASPEPDEDAAPPRATRAARTPRPARKPRSGAAASKSARPSDDTGTGSSDVAPGDRPAAITPPVAPPSSDSAATAEAGTPSASPDAFASSEPAPGEAQASRPKARKTPARPRRPRKTPASDAT